MTPRKFPFRSPTPADKSIWRKRLAYGTKGSVQRLGVPGILAIGTLFLCATIWSSGILKLKTQLQAFEDDGHAATYSANTEVLSTAKRQAEIAAYRASFTDKSQLTALIGQLHTHAETAGIRLANTDFQVVGPESSAPSELPAVIVTVGSSASHEPMIRFVNAVLAGMPNSALESISLKRGKLMDSVLDIQLRFRLYVMTP